MAYKYVYADVSIIVNDRENCSSPFTYFAMRKFASGIKKPESSIPGSMQPPSYQLLVTPARHAGALRQRRKSRDCGTKEDQLLRYSLTTSICLSITSPVKRSIAT